MGRLTEANYLSRRVKLVDALAGAATAHADAAFRREMGDGTDDTVKTAKDAIGTLEDRIVGLDLAWKRTLSDLEAERVSNETRARAAAVRAAAKALAGRTATAKAIDKAARRLAELYKEYSGAGEEALAAVAPFARVLGVQGYANLRDDIHGQFADPASIIAGLLHTSGLKLDGVSGQSASYALADRPLATFVEQRNAAVLSRVAVLTDAPIEHS